MVSNECAMPSFGVELTHVEDEDGNELWSFEYDNRIKSFDPDIDSIYYSDDSQVLPNPPYPLSVDPSTGYFYLEAIQD